MRPSQRFEQQVTTRVDPKLVMASSVLQMTQQELEVAIDAELNDNPALERIEEDIITLDDAGIADSLMGRSDASFRFSSDETYHVRNFDPDDETHDWTDMVASPVSLTDNLRAQLLPLVPPHLQNLARDMVDAVNARGYIEMEIEELALTFDASMDDVDLVLRKLHGCEPTGIGARDLRECLLIQIRQMPQSPVRDLAARMIKDGWEDFTKRRFQKLGRRFKALPALADAAANLVAGLNPFPGEAFRADWEMNSTSAPHSVVPDVIIRRSEAGYEVDIRGFDPGLLSVNGGYKRLFQDRAKLSVDEKKHVVQYVDRASNFITSIQQRRRTLKKIVEYLLDTQEGFIATGSYRFLRSLTRMQLAKEIGVHESTVSRATMNKFVQLPSQEVVSFDVFFKPALRVQKAIEEILMHENPLNPLSDERISQMLKEQGIEVARRTINKYREQLNILSSRRRRA